MRICCFVPGLLTWIDEDCIGVHVIMSIVFILISYMDGLRSSQRLELEFKSNFMILYDSEMFSVSQNLENNYQH